MATVSPATIAMGPSSGLHQETSSKEDDDDDEQHQEQQSQEKKDLPPTETDTETLTPKSVLGFLETIDENESLSCYEASDSDDDDDDGSFASFEGCFDFSSAFHSTHSSPKPSEPDTRNRRPMSPQRENVAHQLSFEQDDDEEDEQDPTTTKSLSKLSSSSKTPTKDVQPSNLREKDASGASIPKDTEINGGEGVSTTTKSVHFERATAESNTETDNEPYIAASSQNDSIKSEEESILRHHHNDEDNMKDICWYQKLEEESVASSTSSIKTAEHAEKVDPIEMIEKAMAKYPILCQYAFFQKLEKRFDCPKEYFFIAFVTSFGVHLISMAGPKLTTDLLATLLPARMTFNALEEQQASRSRRMRAKSQWMTYWLWFSGSIVLEHYLGNNFTTLSYYLMKIITVLWLCHPRFYGGQVIYRNLIRPVWKYLNDVEQDANTQTKHVVTKAKVL